MEIYFDKQNINKKSGSRIKFYLIPFFSGLFLIFIVYALIYSPIFQVRKFSVIGASRFSDEAALKIIEPLVVNNRAANLLGPRNLFVWRNGIDISKTALVKAMIDRSWINQSVIVNVEEKEQFAIWCQIGACYWIDKEGEAFEEAPQTEGSLVLTIYDDGQGGMILGQSAVDERYAKNLIAILDNILNLAVPIRRIEFNKRLQEIKALIYGGPDLLFSIRFDPELNMAALQSLKDKVGLKGIKYVDLRVENRIYYKN